MTNTVISTTIYLNSFDPDKKIQKKNRNIFAKKNQKSTRKIESNLKELLLDLDKIIDHQNFLFSMLDKTLFPNYMWMEADIHWNEIQQIYSDLHCIIPTAIFELWMRRYVVHFLCIAKIICESNKTIDSINQLPSYMHAAARIWQYSCIKKNTEYLEFTLSTGHQSWILPINYYLQCSNMEIEKCIWHRRVIINELYLIFQDEALLAQRINSL